MIKDPFIKSKSLSNVGVLKEDIRICKLSTVKKDRELCIIGVAASTKDIDLCLGLEQANSLDYCRYELAKSSRNYELCSEITNSTVKAWCIRDKVGLEGGVSECDKIEDELQKRYCLLGNDQNLFNKRFDDPSVCAKISDNRYLVCYAFVDCGNVIYS